LLLVTVTRAIVAVFAVLVDPSRPRPEYPEQRRAAADPLPAAASARIFRAYLFCSSFLLGNWGQRQTRKLC
jgi:hypothetical protein